MDYGNSNTGNRNTHPAYSPTDIYTCGGWTSASANFKPDGSNVGRAQIITPVGELKSTIVSANDGGCQTARPLTCCDGYPPE